MISNQRPIPSVTISVCIVVAAYFFWINLSDRSIEGKWVWHDTDKETIYTNWGSNENTGGVNENCAALYSKINYQWADLNCISSHISAICERK